MSSRPEDSPSATVNPWAEEQEQTTTSLRPALPAKSSSNGILEERDAWKDSPTLQPGTSEKSGSTTEARPPQIEIASLGSAFDEFDPFKPDNVDDAGQASWSTQTETDNQVDNKSSPSSPEVPSKVASKPLAGHDTQDNDWLSSGLHDQATAITEAATQSSQTPEDEGKTRITTEKDQNALEAEPAPSQLPKSPAKPSAAMQPSGNTSSTSATSALSNPLATIASAFRKRDFSNTGSPSSSRAGTPSSQAPPTGKPAPAILVRDNDDLNDMEDSEKEAPPAVPSVGSYNAGSGSAGQIGETGEEAVPFDFNFFLEQMRSRSAEPIAKYLRSFLREFTKKMWNVNDQIRVINDFLDFIAIKMRENEVWKTDSEREFDNAVEGMEKLVMNRVFHLTFVPALEPAQQATTQTDDLERDHVLSQRIRLFQWVSEEHLDLPEHKDTASFIEFAKQELRKINSYKAPRDKLICILNSCKVIFGLMRHLNLEDGADTFIPFLILVVLRSNPDHLISNVQYIQRFRNPDRLAGENGYYLSSLTAAISFIETMDASSLSNLTQEQFEEKVEAAIRQLPPDDNQHNLPAAPTQPSSSATRSTVPSSPAVTSLGLASQSLPNSPKKPARPQAEQRVSHQSQLMSSPEQNAPPRSQSPAEATRDFFLRSSDNLQKTVSKPLQALGKIFTEMGSESEIIAGFAGHGQPGSSNERQQTQLATPQLHPPTPRGQRPPSQRSRSQGSAASPISPQMRHQHLPRSGSYAPGYFQGVPPQPQGERPPATNRGSSYQPADFVDDSVPAEEVQAAADRNYQATFNAKIQTLLSIFPGIERETLEIVLLSNGEDVERTIEGLLDMQ